MNLVAKRLDLAAQVGLEKKLRGRPLRDAGVEELVQSRLLAESAARGISPSFTEGVARLLIQESLRRQEEVRPPSPVRQRILVVGGAGQMGHWLCRYFRSRGYDVMVNDVVGAVGDFRFESDLGKGVRRADVAVVSVPISVAADVLRTIAAMNPKGLVFDVCSLKDPVGKQLREMGRAGLRVASIHPMFGPNFWPLSSGKITFSDCGNRQALSEAKELFRATGASFVDVTLDDHDELMAVLLGLSHLCLLTFARCVARGSPDLAGLERPEGTTFTRLSGATADLLADSPALLRDIQALNPHMPRIYRRVRETLNEWEGASTAPDGDAFFRLVEEARSCFGGTVA